MSAVLAANLAACAQAGVVLVEQPLPDGARSARSPASSGRSRSAPMKARMTATSLPALAGKYDAVNIKLDKAGGLTEALAMAAEAERLGFAIMAGCMVATSLAMAPAMLLAQRARYVDLDGPLLLAKDRPDGLRYAGQPGLSAGARAVGLNAHRYSAMIDISQCGTARLQAVIPACRNPRPSPRAPARPCPALPGDRGCDCQRGNRRRTRAYGLGLRARRPATPIPSRNAKCSTAPPDAACRPPT